MNNYIKFDYSISIKKKYYKLIIFILVLILTILISSNIIINKNSNDEIKIISKNSRRIINDIGNYTETMSEFIVNNENNNYIFNEEILNSLNDFKTKTIKSQYEIKEFINIQLKNQEKDLDIQNEMKNYKKREVELQEKQLKIQIKKNAIEFLEKNYGLFSKDFNLDLFINNCNCVKDLLQLKDNDLFSLFLNIDYDNLTVSFNYFHNNQNSTDYYNYEKIKQNHRYLDRDYYNEYDSISYKLIKNNKENIINNPIYNIIKNKLEFNYSYSFEELIPITNSNSFNIVDINNVYYNIIKNNSHIKPYKLLCNINYINHTQYDVMYISNGLIYLKIYSNYFNLNDKIFTSYCYQKLHDSNNYYSDYNYCNTKDNLYMYIVNYMRIQFINYQNSFRFNYIKIYNEYEYIKKIINLENIPIIYPIKF